MNDDSLDKLIRECRASFQAATLEKRAEMHARQRRSWAIGQLLIANPGMAHKDAARIVDGVIGREASEG